MPTVPNITRARLLRGLPALAVLLLTGCTSSAHGATNSAATALTQGPYVALGDSYTAGPDVPNQVGTPSGCQRSDHNYPTLVAQHLKLSAHEVHDVSCTGATISDLTSSQTTDNGTNSPQFDALTSDTALVTLGIGGNDLGFSDVFTRCVELDVPGTLVNIVRHATTDLAPCRTYYTAGGTDQIDKKLEAAATRIEVALDQIRQRSPHARVYVVGYPALLPVGGTSCAHKLGITTDDVSFLNTKEMELNAMLQQHAEQAGATYVDTYTPSVGHDACSDPATRWIEPIITDGSAAPLHPNAHGEQQMAAAVENAMTNPEPRS